MSGGSAAPESSDADDKYAKIRRQQWKFRQLSCFVFLVLVAVGFLLSGNNLEVTEDMLLKAEHSAGRAAAKLMNEIKEKEKKRFVHEEGGIGGDAASAGGGGGASTRLDVTPVRANDDRAAAVSGAERGENDVARRNVRARVGGSSSESELAKEVERLDAEVRRVKKSLPDGHFMETDPTALEATGKLQTATRQLLAERYGPSEPYHVRVVLEFQDTIPDYAEKGRDGEFTIELAPSYLVPHSIFSFLEIARNWKGGAFHRIAGHVLQVMVGGNVGRSLAFQEYSSEYPHLERTVGYAGRPSGPAWYVSIQNNKHNHGPGSQQNKNPHEADSCIGTVIKGYEDSVLRITKVPGNGFLSDRKKHVIIKKMEIMVPGDGPGAVDGYVEWKPKTGMASA